MSSQLYVEYHIERSLGKPGGIGNERFEIRFWLSTTVDGKKVDSRGTTVETSQPSMSELNRWMQQIVYTISGVMLRNQWTSKDAKEVNAQFPQLVADAIAEDAQFHADFNSFAK